MASERIAANNAYLDQNITQHNLSMSGAPLPSHMSSELQDRIDDIKRIQPKKKSKA